MMNLNHLAIFHAVAMERSISRGAERLMVSQPAVSKQLAQLERSLGTRLLDRFPRGVRLTEAGELLAGYARRIFALETEAGLAVDEVRGLRRGRLRIGASTTLGVYLLPEMFVRFTQQHPEVQTRFDVAGSATVERRLLEGDLDVGFTEAFSESRQLQAEVFRTDDLVAIAARAHPLARKRRVSAEQFCKEPFVVRDTGSETKSFVERSLAEKGLIVRPVMSLGSTEAIKRAVAAGIGVAIVSRLAIGLELQVRRLAIVPLTGLRIRRPLYQVRMRAASRSAAADEFAAMLVVR